MTSRATGRTWGFQLVVLLPENRRLSGETRQTWSLPEPVGDVKFSAAGETLQDARELTFRGSGYATEEAAQLAGELFRDRLRVASALFGPGFDVGGDLPQSGLGDDVKAAFEAKLRQDGKFLVPDIHGLVVYEEQGEPVRFSLRAAGIVIQQSSTVLKNVLTIASGSPLTDEQSLACDLVSLAEHEVSDRARFLILVTAMEVLADRPKRTGGLRTLIEHFIKEAERSRTAGGPDEEGRYSSLLGGLKDLRSESISWSIRDLAVRSRPDDPRVPGLVRRIYSCRGTLLHKGRPTEDLRALLASAQELVRDMISYAVSLGVGPKNSPPSE